MEIRLSILKSPAEIKITIYSLTIKLIIKLRIVNRFNLPNFAIDFFRIV